MATGTGLRRALLLGCALSLAAPGCAGRGAGRGERCMSRGYPRTRGLYAVVPLDAPVPPALLDDPLVDGLVVQLSWRKIQPTAQWAPDWSPLDATLAAARLHGKRVVLRVEAGVHAPDWVYAAGARSFPFLWEGEGGFGLCARVSAPLPWDPVHLGAWNALIWSAGQRFNQNTALTHVQLTGLGALPARSAMPLSRNLPLGNWRVSCRTADNVAELRSAGYTRARLAGAWEDVLRTFRAAFPAHQLAITVGRRGFPGEEDRATAPRAEAGKDGRPGPGDAELPPPSESSVEAELQQRALLPGPSRVLILIEQGATGAGPERSPVGVRLGGDEADMRAALDLTDAGRRAQYFEVSAATLGIGRLRPALAKLRTLVRGRPAR